MPLICISYSLFATSKIDYFNNTWYIIVCGKEMIQMAAPETGPENKTTIKLTQEEIEQIKNLPKRTFLIGNIRQTGLYDEATKRFYYLDADGEWTGRLAIISTPPPQEPRSNEDDDPSKADENQDDSDDAEDGDEDNGESTSLVDKAKEIFSSLKKNGDGAASPIMEKLRTPISKRIPLTWMHVLIVGIILILLMVFVITPAVNRVFAPPDVPPASSTEVDTPSGAQSSPEGSNTQTSEPDPTLSNIQVIQVKDTMIPGDTITSDCVQSAEISAADYELLRANGRVLYQWDVVNNLIGMVVNKYIPKGGYIASGDESATYTPSSNPWVTEEDGKTFVTIPLTDEIASSADLNFGAKINIFIKKRTSTQTSQEGDDTIVTTTSEKSYTFASTVVCDILNSNEESLYPLYSAYLAIPAGERLSYLRTALVEDETLAQRLTPAYIRVKIDSTSATEIGDFNSNSVTIALRIPDASDIDNATDQKRDFASQARALDETIEQAIALNDEAAQQAQAEAQQQALEQQQEG